ncbi:hypothetical protein N7G274_009477 [Stereocaulon virgatum]|uniref:Uncharacterized protein n=1 Tax=Stereocaulon virgatum TaxID=373712 RepID=A0ABR3ZVW6_9LECA
MLKPLIALSLMDTMSNSSVPALKSYQEGGKITTTRLQLNYENSIPLLVTGVNSVKVSNDPAFLHVLNRFLAPTSRCATSLPPIAMTSPVNFSLSNFLRLL